jgi:TonB family protein
VATTGRKLTSTPARLPVCHPSGAAPPGTPGWGPRTVCVTDFHERIYQVGGSDRVSVCFEGESVSARRARIVSGELLASGLLDRSELKRLLRLWLVPRMRMVLDERIARSFHSHRESPIGIASPRFPPTTTTEVSMKRCNACDQEFEDKFSFCPLDATPLSKPTAAVVGGGQRSEVGGRRSEAGGQRSEVRGRKAEVSRRAFRLTIIDNTSLLERLARELRFLVRQLRQAWPDVKSDPVGFGKRAAMEGWLRIRSTLAAPNSLAAITTALLVVLSAVMILALSDRLAKEKAERADNAGDEPVQIVSFLPDPNANLEDRGVGAGSQGRVGFARGRGEGSAPEPRKSTGGGGGGLHDPLPTQLGKPPQPSAIPAPIPQFPPVQKQTLPVAGIDIDPALWKNLPMAVYGDPRSKSSTPSNGPGDGGGMGTANGTGTGEGSGPGFGPGRDGNIGGGPKGPPGGGGIGGSYGSNPEDPDRAYPTTQVTERARVLLKPEPQYTEDARRNLIMGTVVLRVVFSRTGEVTNIRAIHALPFGLTERAITAARLIRFRPATRDGRPVNVNMQLEYNFNLY